MLRAGSCASIRELSTPLPPPIAPFSLGPVGKSQRSSHTFLNYTSFEKSCILRRRLGLYGDVKEKWGRFNYERDSVFILFVRHFSAAKGVETLRI